MLIKGQEFKVKINKRTKDWYESKGYDVSSKEIFVKAEDLSKSSERKVKVVCDNCGCEYEIAWNHYMEHPTYTYCGKCRNTRRYQNNLSKRQDKLYIKLLKVCNNRGYALITTKSEIKNNTTYIEYICPIHGIQKARLNNLINGKGCPECAKDARRKMYQLSADEVEHRISECGGVLLNKEEYINQTTSNLRVLCPQCGNEFVASLRNFTQHGGQVCDDCNTAESIGEMKIRMYLESNNIHFIQEYWFSDCRDKNPLPFDFYLPNNNVIIEFDGRQHFEETNHFTYSFDKVKEHDKIKNKYCYDNGIKLIRISYKQINKIDEILNKELFLHKDIV